MMLPSTLSGTGRMFASNRVSWTRFIGSRSCLRVGQGSVLNPHRNTEMRWHWGYSSIGLEISPDTHERSYLASSKAVFQVIGAIWLR